MIRFTFTARYHGHTGQITIEHNTMNGILAQLGELERAGVESVQTEWEHTPEGLPICRKHREVMSRREKQGDVWHSHSIIDPISGERMYCRGYAGLSSPGYDLPADAPRPGYLEGVQEEPEANEDLDRSEPHSEGIRHPPRHRKQTLQAQAQQARATTQRQAQAQAERYPQRHR